VMPLLPREGWHITACHHLGPSALELNTAPFLFDRRSKSHTRCVSLWRSLSRPHTQGTQSFDWVRVWVEVFGYRSWDRRAWSCQQAQYAFKVSMIHWALQFTLRIAFRCVLHRCENQDIHC